VAIGLCVISIQMVEKLMCGEDIIGAFSVSEEEGWTETRSCGTPEESKRGDV